MSTTFTRPCLWCGEKMSCIYLNKTYCSGRCHTAAHRTRQSDWGWLSPRDFKRMILDWLSQDVPNHPNPNHPAALLNQQAAEVWRNATKIIEAFKDSLAFPEGGL